MQAAMEDIMAGFNPWYANWAQEQVAQGKVPTMEDGRKAYLERSEEVQKKIADAIMGSIDMEAGHRSPANPAAAAAVGKDAASRPRHGAGAESQLQESITTAMSSYMQNDAGRVRSRCRPR